jgi:thiamine pyrophosphate-dependent acetolactate synthase large subunit-like protein
VLFVGHDASSPEIAASLLRSLAGDRVAVVTASTQSADPTRRSDEMLVAMGLNPPAEQRLSTGALHAADLVVSLGAGLDVARVAGPRYEEWDLSQEDLLGRVRALSHDLTTPPNAEPRRVMLDRLRTWLGATRRR